MRKHTLIVGILSFIILLLAGVGFWAYCLILAPDFEPRKTVYVYIDEKKDFGDLCRQLVDSAGCRRIGSFKQLAGMLKYPTNMRTGRYAVEPGMNNLALLNNLRRGHQEATRITFNNIRFKLDLAERLAGQLMIEEDDLLPLLVDSVYCASLGFTTETILALFIPNTYEVYWNISAEGKYSISARSKKATSCSLLGIREPARRPVNRAAPYLRRQKTCQIPTVKMKISAVPTGSSRPGPSC